MTFQPFDNTKQIKFLEDGKIIVIKPIANIISIPLFCPVCGFPMKTSDDSSSFREFQCCHLCDLNFAHSNKEKWLEKGWRPSKEELKPYIEEKKQSFKQLFIFK